MDNIDGLLTRGAYQARPEHGVRGLELSVLKFARMKPVRETLLGTVDATSDTKRRALRPDESLRQAPHVSGLRRYATFFCALGALPRKWMGPENGRFPLRS